MLQMMPPILSLSLFVSSSSPAATALTATALTDAMSQSVPFFFCSDVLTTHRMTAVYINIWQQCTQKTTGFVIVFVVDIFLVTELPKNLT